MQASKSPWKMGYHEESLWGTLPRPISVGNAAGFPCCWATVDISWQFRKYPALNAKRKFAKQQATHSKQLEIIIVITQRTQYPGYSSKFANVTFHFFPLPLLFREIYCNPTHFPSFKRSLLLLKMYDNITKQGNFFLKNPFNSLKCACSRSPFSGMLSQDRIAVCLSCASLKLFGLTVHLPAADISRKAWELEVHGIEHASTSMFFFNPRRHTFFIYAVCHGLLHFAHQNVLWYALEKGFQA